jgi:hypothetical protein
LNAARLNDLFRVFFLNELVFITKAGVVHVAILF